MNTAIDIVILAAGQGKRMKSARAKVLHQLAGRALLRHVIDTSSRLDNTRLFVVVGHDAEDVEASLSGVDAKCIVQAEQLGTGHALQQVLSYLDPEAITLVLYGDVPMIREKSLRALINTAMKGAPVLLTIELDHPHGYGRIVRDANNAVIAIVEQRDASERQRGICEINTGIMALPGAYLAGWLDRLSNDNAQGEYYLTDIIAMAVADGVSVQTCLADNEYEVAGVNSRKQLANLERYYQRSRAEALMDEGISFADPARFDLRGNLVHGHDVFIDINVVLEGELSLGDRVQIGPGCVIRNAEIGTGTRILPHSVIDGVVIGADCSIGPFARLRPGTRLAKGAKIGNFVETKKADIGACSKISHLSYVGDASLGTGVNIGAGTITCNYDGANKHHTTIGDGAFIGSNTALVAPVEVGSEATVAAGSVITKAVPDKALAVARGKQRNVEDWQQPTKANREQNGGD